MAGSRGSRCTNIAAAVLVLVAATFTPTPAGAATGTITRVSVSSDGTQGSASSNDPSLTNDGRYVAFTSSASNLVAGDTNTFDDIFVHDAQAGTTSRVNVASDGAQANESSRLSSLTADGRFVVFESNASNLVADDTNSTTDLFVHDRLSGTTSRVSIGDNGTQGNNASSRPKIGDDGLRVAFDSSASNLVPGDTNQTNDVFLRDRQTGVIERISLSSAGGQGNGSSSLATMSADGRFIAFQSNATNLVPRPEPCPVEGLPTQVCDPWGGDTNAASDVFVRDRQSGATARVSVASNGVQADSGSANATISADGRYVSFASSASNLVAGDTNGVDDIFVHDRQTGSTARVSVASDGSQATFGAGVKWTADPTMTPDGRFVAFGSSASNLVPDGKTSSSTPGLFVHDRHTTATTRAASGTSLDRPPNLDLSDDGRYLAFNSEATKLVPGDTNNARDVFVYDSQGVPGPTPVLLAVGNVGLYEGDVGARAAVFTVSLSKPAATTVSVNYATVDASATAGSDYTAGVGTLNFDPGTTSLAVKVPVEPDSSDETAAEVFTLSLSGPNGAIIADPSGLATIVDDDPATVGGRRLAIGDATVHEGEAGTRVAVFNVNLSTPASSTVSVKYATANDSATKPGDYLGKTGTLSFAPGTTSQSVKVIINGDTAIESPTSETFKVVLSEISGPKTAIFDNTGIGTILGDD